MAITRCLHCGAEADTNVVSITHKSNCHSAGKDSDNIVVGDVKPVAAPKATVTTSPKKSTSTGGKKSRK